MQAKKIQSIVLRYYVSQFMEPLGPIKKWMHRQRGTGLLTDKLLENPLSDAARRDRRSLLGLSLLSVFIVWTGLIPSEISALGLTFEETDKIWLVRVVVVLIVYFWGTFLIHGTSDFLAWRVAHWTALDQKRQSVGIDPESVAFQEIVRKRDNLLIASRAIPPLRLLIDLLVPLFFGAFAIYVLFSYDLPPSPPVTELG